MAIAKGLETDKSSESCDNSLRETNEVGVDPAADNTGSLEFITKHALKRESTEEHGTMANGASE